jgi:hypothetical protein
MKFPLIPFMAAAALCSAVAFAQPTPEEPKRPRRHPSAEAVEACNGRADGDFCRFTLGDNSLDGRCRPNPDGAFIACFPGPAEEGR